MVINNANFSAEHSVIVSIIMPLYNSSAYVARSIESVLSQSYRNWELILVDDFSTDDTLLIIQSYLNSDKRIKLIKSELNVGAAVARNMAIEKASGKYLCFLDSDDIWLPEKLATQVSYMEQNNVLFSFMAYFKVDADDNKIGCVHVPDVVSYNDLLRTCSIGCLTAMFNAEVLGKQMMPLLRKRQDYGLWLKLIKLSGKAYGINMPLSCYRVHSESISSNKFNAAKYQWRIYREVEGLNIFKTCYYFTTYMVYGILKTKVPRLYSLLIK
ncbi:glycosyltransferase family 2 protein [Aeromonas media]|uniref:glycosyltransferase family 2 protein n=1 Tax=Aeromonas media TaxID=651 RepID=UPI002281B842|nr:glycosyltransferase family 2 protein [Aeromonas media]MCY9821472.1 glycosyltransferase family 2 protein [Aeromonas media]